MRLRRSLLFAVMGVSAAATVGAIPLTAAAGPPADAGPSNARGPRSNAECLRPLDKPRPPHSQPRKRALRCGSSGGQARGDFNGDGVADLAVGAPGESVGAVAGAGAVNVIYGSTSGLTASGPPTNQLWTQDSPNVFDFAEDGDGFGSALAAGDFNGDGFSDLAVGVPFEDVGGRFDAGAVNVLYGSVAGLTPTGNQLWTQDSEGVADVAETSDQFGRSLVWATFNPGSEADLAIGAPGEDVGTILGAGLVNVLYGGVTGLSAAGNTAWTQESPGVLDLSENSDVFGGALTAGDFNRDGFADLAIGVPLEDVGTLTNPGAVNVLYGSRIGLTGGTVTGIAGTRASQLWHQDVRGVLDTAEEPDQFGSALTAGDFDRDGTVDLAVGVPAESIAGAVAAGAVNVLRGSSSGLTAEGNQFHHQDSEGVLDTAESFDFFATAVAAGDFNGDAAADLAVGVPQETVGTLDNSGAVNVLYGNPAGLGSADQQFWHQDTPEVDGAAEAFDSFGSALTGWNFGTGAQGDLAIGARQEAIGSILNAGSVNVLYGTELGLTAVGDQLWHQDVAGILDSAENGDGFGAALY